MSESQLKKIIDDLRREIISLKNKIAQINERHYKEDIKKLTFRK